MNNNVAQETKESALPKCLGWTVDYIAGFIAQVWSRNKNFLVFDLVTITDQCKMEMTRKEGIL